MTHPSPSASPTAATVLCRHADVVAAANDPQTFSSAVSRFLQVPNGLDGEAHRQARELFDPFFAPDRMASVAPAIEKVAHDLVATLHSPALIDAVELGGRFAVRAQSAWLGWSGDLEPDLLAWMRDNHEATRSGDLARTTEVAQRFDQIITDLLQARQGQDEPADLTAELLFLRDETGQPLPQEVLVSVLRNWTGGDLGSLALCAGVILHWLAHHPEHQREWLALDQAGLAAAIEEVLRIDDPFVSNRRRTTRPVEIAGELLPAGHPVVLHWTAANQDPQVFPDPDVFDPERHAAANLVYGTGPHACPGRPLANLELVALVSHLLRQFHIEPAAEAEPVRSEPPVGGWQSVPLTLTRHQ